MLKGLLSGLFVLSLSFKAHADNLDRIIIGTVHFPPYTIEDLSPNGLKGFDYEVVTEAFRRMGIESDIQFMPWKRALQKAQNGTIAAIIPCSVRPQFTMSAPLSKATDALFLRQNFNTHAFPITQVKDLKNHPNLTIGGVDGYNQLSLLDAEDLPYDRSPDDSSGFKKLFSGRIDVFLTIKEFGDYTLQKLELSHLAKRIPLSTKEYHVCFSKAFEGTNELKNEFNETLLQLRNDGTYDAIHAKYR